MEIIQFGGEMTSCYTQWYGEINPTLHFKSSFLAYEYVAIKERYEFLGSFLSSTNADIGFFHHEHSSFCSSNSIRFSFTYSEFDVRVGPWLLASKLQQAHENINKGIQF